MSNFRWFMLNIGGLALTLSIIGVGGFYLDKFFRVEGYRALYINQCMVYKGEVRQKCFIDVEKDVEEYRKHV